MSAASPAGADPVIILDHVVKRFGDYVAVEDANFSIGRGEFFSMLGPSGCGKTTTLRMIAGFEQPTSGRLLLEGQDVSHVPPYQRNVNTVFQHYALFPHMSVYDNIAFGPRSKKANPADIDRRVSEIIEVVRLGQFAQRKPAQLSGGQQQRVALARALVNHPSALLLDEPLGALDLKLRQAMQVELKRIQREVGITFIYVTHDQEEALTMSDRIAVMNEGRVEQIAPPEEIYHSPSSVFVANFIGVANLIPATVKGVKNGQAEVTVAGSRPFDVPVGSWQGQTGSSATVTVRPERIRLEDNASGPNPAVPATVQHVIFQGPVTRCLLKTADGTEIIAHLGHGEGKTTLAPGQSTQVCWDAEAGRLLPPPKS